MVLLTLENVLLHLSYICFLQDDDELCTSMTFFLGDQTYALSHKFKHILSSSYMHDIYKLTFDYVYAIRYINISFTLYWEFCCQVGCSKFRNAATGAGVLGQFFFFSFNQIFICSILLSFLLIGTFIISDNALHFPLFLFWSLNSSIFLPLQTLFPDKIKICQFNLLALVLLYEWVIVLATL